MVKSKDSSKGMSKTVKIILGIIALLILIAIVIVIILAAKIPKNIGPTKSTTCELNNYSCFNNSCSLGYTEVDMACKTGEVCCKKVPVNEKNQCERAGLNCYKTNCPAGWADIDLFCGAGSSCCKEIVVEKRTNCELQGFQCFGSILPEPACPTNYISNNLSCKSGEICCKQAPQKNKIFVIYGYVKIKEGNCMPPIGSDCKTTPLSTQIAVFTKTLETQMSGTYFRTAVGPITMISSNESGYYEVELPYGDYSVFARDPQGNNDYYCNALGFGDAVCFVPLTNSKEFDILIDHSTQ